MKQKNIIHRKIFSVILSLAVLVGFMPQLAMPAYAATDIYSNLIPTEQDNEDALNAKKVKFNGKPWFIIEDNSTSAGAGTVTLLVADTSFGTSSYNPIGGVYRDSKIKKELKEKTDSGDFKGVANAIVETDNGKLYLLSSSEARELPDNVRVLMFTGGSTERDGYWWLRDNDVSYNSIWAVKSYDNGNLVSAVPTKVFGVRPALQLDLSKVVFDSESKTFTPAYGVTLSGGANAVVSGGATTQEHLKGAMETVTYTAKDGYHFDEFSDITSNGVTATRTSDTVVTVSGTPADTATITIPDAHRFEFKDFTWTGNETDGYTAAVANYLCEYSDEHTTTAEATLSEEVTDPTCTEAGKTTYTATVAAADSPDGEEHKESKDGKPTDPKNHDWDEPRYTWARDNSEVTAAHVCKNDASHVEIETVDVTSEVTKEPTCTEKGEATYTSAAFPNSAFKVQTKTVELPVQPNNHVWDEGEEIQAQDICGGKGMLYTCKLCGETKEEGTGEHVWETKYTVFTAPTCTEPGEEFYKCSKCDAMDLERPHVIPALGHDWGTPSYKWAADNSSVTAERVCGHDSSHKETETVDTVKTTKDATCEEKGEITYTATFENGAFEKQTKTEEIPAIGHKWTEPSYTWSDDYSEVTAERKCEICDKEEKETVKTKTTIIKEANCKEKGENKYIATFENKAFEEQSKTVEQPVQPNNHAWDEGKEIEDQDICGGKGMQYTCSICGKTKVEGIGDHDWSTEWTIYPEPTCTEGGNRFHKCKNCDAYNFEDFEVLDPLGHDWGEPTYEWAEDNSSVTAERVCGHDASHKETEKVDTVKTTTKDATCTEKGEATYTATFKNGAFEKQTKTEEIPVLNHPWDEGKVTKEPTTEEEGIKTYTCTVCGETKTEAIPKIKPEKKSTIKPVLVAKGIASGKTAANLSWNKVKDADRYEIYLSKCNYKGKKYTMKKVKTVSGKTLKWTKKGLKKNTAYKFYVKALKKSGKKYELVAKSKTAHFFTTNVRGKYTNPKSLKLKKSKITLNKGKSTTIKGTVTKVKKSKKLATTHAAKLRFTSNNPTVAKVNAKGKVTAKKAGTATIYVQTINGIWKTCKITVK